MITIWVPKRLVEVGLYNVAARSPAELAALSEQSYRERVRYAAEKVRFSGTKIVMLTGPSASGKTTSAHKLAEELERQGTPARVVSLDNFFRGALLLQGASDAVGAGGLAAGRRAGEHDDLCAGHADLLGGIIHPLGIAVLAQLCQLLRAAGRHIVKVDLNQTLRDPDRDHKNQPLLFSVPVPPQSAGYTRSDT